MDMAPDPHTSRHIDTVETFGSMDRAAWPVALETVLAAATLGTGRKKRSSI